MKKLFTLILCLLLLAGCKKTDVPEQEDEKLAIKSISKYGNIVIDKTIEEAITMGFNVADIVVVSVNGQEYEMPVGNSYSDVDSGSMLLRYDEEDDEVSVAINNGNFATTTGLFSKVSIEEDPGYKWVYEEPIEITIKIKEVGGYKDEYEIRQLERTYERSDYAKLSDEQYSNFRAVFDGILYRSSSPVDPDLNRNKESDNAMAKYGIKTTINVDDKLDEMLGYEGYSDTYYATTDINIFEMDYNYNGEIFKKAMKGIIQTIIDKDGPFLIHCKEGKDRTGIICALFEAFNGWDLASIEDDYMATYYNYYGVEKNSDKYKLILKTNLHKNLCIALNINNVEDVNLETEVFKYFNSIGISNDQIAQLQAKFPNYITK